MMPSSAIQLWAGSLQSLLYVIRFLPEWRYLVTSKLCRPGNWIAPRRGSESVCPFTASQNVDISTFSVNVARRGADGSVKSLR
jgi:hypothetical protein